MYQVITPHCPAPLDLVHCMFGRGVTRVWTWSSPIGTLWPQKCHKMLLPCTLIVFRGIQPHIFSRYNLPNNSMFNTNGAPLRGMGGNSVELQRFER